MKKTFAALAAATIVRSKGLLGWEEQA